MIAGRRGVILVYTGSKAEPDEGVNGFDSVR
jgi:hypothetical protein